MGESIRRDIRLYIDDATRETFQAEADHAGVSFSAYVRVVGQVLREWYHSPMDRPVSDLRERVKQIIDQAERRV